MTDNYAKIVQDNLDQLYGNLLVRIFASLRLGVAISKTRNEIVYWAESW